MKTSRARSFDFGWQKVWPSPKAYAEPAARSDTSGKVLKPAKIETGCELMVPAFVEQGDKRQVIRAG
ncbi:hypothetical protein ORJ00_14390 [Rheinheimera baltica]|uniref:hypothetical protein n=1 Tax=Rheinheimera baltica TaxID=67576 RepID=UPI00273DBF78|nr:hypothetical protein [Rheinheimera baltica]MDP5143933.1 hypothetical protein [Rheinheimera baltica]